MSGKKRSYRKNLTSYGLIYLHGEELEVAVKNVSITGVLAELYGNDTIYEIEALFDAIEQTTLIDLYLPEMRVAGEAEITRADMADGKMYLALEFRNLTYDVSNLLYKRRAYRKNMTAPGQIVFYDQEYAFFTKNVSVDGMTIILSEYIVAYDGLLTTFSFRKLDLKGEIKVVWIEYLEDNCTMMGLQYVKLERAEVSGIPQFLPKEPDGY